MIEMIKKLKLQLELFEQNKINELENVRSTIVVGGIMVLITCVSGIMANVYFNKYLNILIGIASLLILILATTRVKDLLNIIKISVLAGGINDNKTVQEEIKVFLTTYFSIVKKTALFIIFFFGVLSLIDFTLLSALITIFGVLLITVTHKGEKK